MRAYIIEELSPEAVEKVVERCREMDCHSSLTDLFWLPLPKTLLTEDQQAHDPECGPHSLSLECGPDFLRLELLVRGRGPIRCGCIAYCTPEQREHMMQYLDDMLQELGIAV